VSSLGLRRLARVDDSFHLGTHVVGALLAAPSTESFELFFEFVFDLEFDFDRHL
jgi:hypothetical protein